MHRVIARTRSSDVPESRAKSFVPDGIRQEVGKYIMYYQEFETEAEARCLVMRSIMHLNWWKADEMRLKIIDFLYRDYYATDDVFITYDDTDRTKTIKNAAEERNH